jgi:hypothetical protein
MTTFSIQQQIEEVEREIALREDVYKRHYTGSNKSRGEYFLARMRAVLKSLWWNRDNREDVIEWIKAGKPTSAEIISLREWIAAGKPKKAEAA